MISSLKALYKRDLEKLTKELSLYGDESTLWIIDKEIKNCSGNLALHLAGNLQHFIGAILGGTGYVRDREFEFNGKNVTRENLIKEVEGASTVVSQTLSTIDPAQLDVQYPLEVFGSKMSTGFFLFHLYGHLNYHLGQINYHRRLLDK